MTPRLLINPYVAFKPTVPHKLAGIRIDPPVSDPNAAEQNEAATAAPDPPLDPPGTRSASHGFRVGGVTFPQANSCILVLPRSTAPPWRSRVTAAAST